MSEKGKPGAGAGPPMFSDEAERIAQFPVVQEKIFLAHAGVTALPRAVASAMQAQIEAGCSHHQEFGDVLAHIGEARVTAAKAVGAQASEIALLGPTSLGLSLFANGIDWREGDEVLCYGEDYPANVYPWLNLERRGVVVRRFVTDPPGRITPETILEGLTPKTRLVALASCHFLTGWRIDVDAVGEMLRKKGILFSLDAIQTIGAFFTPTRHVDFLSADAHKWMLGPLAIGIVFVAERSMELCRPTLLGAWNVQSPDFLALDEIRFEPGARRYEPGVLNVPGIYGMKAALELIARYGQERVSARILELRDALEERLASDRWEFLSPAKSEPLRSGILAARPPSGNPERVFRALEANGVVASLRRQRDGSTWLRFSPHFYNTPEEIERVAGLLQGG